MPPKGKGGKGAKGKHQIYGAERTKLNKHHMQLYSTFLSVALFADMLASLVFVANRL